MNTSILFVLLFGISGGEIFIVLLLVLILFGPKKIPEIAKTIGKGMNEIKKVQRDINAEINRYSREMENPVRQIKEDIEGYRKGLDQQVEDAFKSPDVATGDITAQQPLSPAVADIEGSSDVAGYTQDNADAVKAQPQVNKLNDTDNNKA